MLRPTRIAGVSLVCLLLLTWAACEIPKSEPDQITGKVVRVADGDTLTVRTATGEQTKIRLFGIDAPERSQAFGRKSQQSLADLVAGRDITIAIEDEDQYGRLVGVIYRDDTNVNTAMLEQGMAWVYRRYNDDPEWIELETRARDERRGLWRDPNPVPPHEWRKRHLR